jgi:tRNA dimethylallyltransferase
MSESTPFRALAVCGPTASGKSALGVTLANALSGEVLNLDSVQVYRGLDVGSAKISALEQCGVPHHLLDIFNPDQPANVALFRDAALDALRLVTAREKIPILIGGAGMYLTALLHGLAPLPPSNATLRADLQKRSPQELHAQLREIDAVSADRINENDSIRVSRALEVWFATGRKPSEVFSEHNFIKAEVIALIVVLCHPRGELYNRIDRRAQTMADQGLIEETAEIRRLYGNTPALTTIGYQQACQVLDGTMPRESLVDEIALHTRRFAKRQMTYWRNEPRKREWLVRPTDDEAGETVEGFDTHPARGQKYMKGFRAFKLTEGELVVSLRERLSRPLERTEVWNVWLVEA